MVQVPSLWGARKTFYERFCALEYNEDAHWAVEIQPLSPERAPVLPAGKVCETNVEALRCFLTAGCVWRFYLCGQGWGRGCPYSSLVCSAQPSSQDGPGLAP